MSISRKSVCSGGVCKPHCEQSCLCFSKEGVPSTAVIFGQTTRIPVRIPFQTPFQTDPDPIQTKISQITTITASMRWQSFVSILLDN